MTYQPGVLIAVAYTGGRIQPAFLITASPAALRHPDRDGLSSALATWLTSL
jgi:hypothetical protein